MSKHTNPAEMFIRHDAANGILEELYRFDPHTRDLIVHRLFGVMTVRDPEACREALDYGHLLQARREADTPNTEAANDRS